MASLNKSVEEGLVSLFFRAAGETVKTVFQDLRRYGPVSEAASNVEDHLDNIEGKQKKLEKQKEQEEEELREKMPEFRSLDDVLSAPSEAMTYLLGGLMIEGGIYVLFANKGQGKSSFAMQLGIVLANGESFKLFDEYDKPSDETPHHVIYLDYELDTRQIQQRYKGLSVPTFHWMGKCSSSGTKECMELANRYISHVPEGESTVLFIDNLSKIGSGYTQPAEAKELYTSLEKFKKVQKEKYNRSVTIVLLTHTTKDSKSGTPITKSDYSGAQDLIVPADGIFAIGPTKLGNDTKYFKVLENRNIMQPNTVSVIKHVNSPYSCFEFVDEMSEEDVLEGKKATKSPKSKPHPNKRGRTVKKPQLTVSQVAEMKEMLASIDPETGKIYIQSKVAEHYGIEQPYVSHYLSGKLKPIPD